MARILIVDDEALIREGLARALRSFGSVVPVATGEDALREASGEPVALCFLDLTLPGMDGLKTGQRMHELSPDTKIVVMTANLLTDHAVRTMEEFACRLLPKPFNLSDVKALASEFGAGTGVSPGKERRATERTVMVRPFRLTLSFANSGGPGMVSETATVVDMSSGGMCIHLNAPLKTGLAVMLDRKRGTVRWERLSAGSECTAGVQYS